MAIPLQMNISKMFVSVCVRVLDPHTCFYLHFVLSTRTVETVEHYCG